ncbi:MAG TPA: HNH endonuclease family protein [Amnibacterium sp.]|nr:HNH endonuclease family protein [Amnibacterium sp.]
MARRRRGTASTSAAVAGLLVVAAVAFLALRGAGSGGGAQSAARPDSAAPTGSAGSALALLATLPVKGKAPHTGYARVKDFGTAWLDVDRNGCDTRDDVLRRDLQHVTSAGCKVETGLLADPYTRKAIHFVRGATTSEAVQIDHVVALSEAWQTGAQQLSQAQRERLANDPTNLFAVDGPTNQAKGDGDAATWLPPNRSFRCTYVAHQVAVKATYHLWVTAAEKAAIERVLAACPGTPAPASALR